ncbi:hypothetical protein V9K67_24695 [Paraflavisolibacter sp. H34]|uniref:hypothetical protein n=1 Tax=Huijunlia imazamoxiresistens TaxID=3127457 RepID=UPI00301AEC96
MRKTLLRLAGVVLLVLSLLSVPQVSCSQSLMTGNGKFEFGVGIGPLIFLGDLAGQKGKGKPFIKDVNLPLTRLVKGAYANIYPAEWLGIRLAVNIGTLESYDSLIADQGSSEVFRKNRNLQFISPLTEAFLALEFYPTVFLEKREGLRGKLRPYGLIGVGLFHFNPKGQYIETDGSRRWVALQPLRLEGQGMAEYPDRQPYKLTSMEMPLGMGIKYYFRENKYIGLEVLHRFTATDYMDDVSRTYINAQLFQKYLPPQQAAMARQLYYRGNLVDHPTRTAPRLNEQRGNPENNDSYFSALLRLGWRLNNPLSAHHRALMQLRCPRFF